MDSIAHTIQSGNDGCRAGEIYSIRLPLRDSNASGDLRTLHQFRKRCSHTLRKRSWRTRGFQPVNYSEKFSVTVVRNQIPERDWDLSAVLFYFAYHALDR